jgi:hypothetical protein
VVSPDLGTVRHAAQALGGAHPRRGTVRRQSGNLRKNRDELAAKSSSYFVAAAKGSRALFEQFAADQHAADFARAGADLVELGVTQQPPERAVVGVAVSA